MKLTTEPSPIRCWLTAPWYIGCIELVVSVVIIGGIIFRVLWTLEPLDEGDMLLMSRSLVVGIISYGLIRIDRFLEERGI